MEILVTNPNVCIIAGEASGDAQGALLVHALRDEFKEKESLI